MTVNVSKSSATELISKSIEKLFNNQKLQSTASQALQQPTDCEETRLDKVFEHTEEEEIDQETAREQLKEEQTLVKRTSQLSENALKQNTEITKNFKQS